MISTRKGLNSSRTFNSKLLPTRSRYHRIRGTSSPLVSMDLRSRFMILLSWLWNVWGVLIARSLSLKYCRRTIRKSLWSKVIGQSISMLNMEIITKPEFLIAPEIFNTIPFALTCVFLPQLLRFTGYLLRRESFLCLSILILISTRCTSMKNWTCWLVEEISLKYGISGKEKECARYRQPQP